MLLSPWGGGFLFSLLFLEEPAEGRFSSLLVPSHPQKFFLPTLLTVLMGGVFCLERLKFSENVLFPSAFRKSFQTDLNLNSNIIA